jgi:hypothetical protein
MAAEVPGRDVTFTDKIALLNKVKTSRLAAVLANWGRYV